MAESVILLGIVIAVRMAYRAVAWRMAMAGERARNRELLAVLRAARPGSVVVSRRADGHTLIICPRPGESAR